MRALTCLLLLAACAVGTVAASPPEAAVFPKLPAPVPPTPPAPPPVADVSVLPANRLYVIQLNADAIVLASPPGLVKITVEPGPFTVRSLFVDGSDKLETRKYTSKSVALVEGVADGRVELLVIPKGVTDESAILRRVVDVKTGTAPIPPPAPEPKPVDPKPVDPKPSYDNPFPGTTGLHVLMTFDPKAMIRKPVTQQAVVYGADARATLNTKCAKGDDGHNTWRIYPVPTNTVAAGKVWQGAYGNKRDADDWIYIANGSKYYSGPLPTSVEDLDALIKKYSEK